MLHAGGNITIGTYNDNKGANVAVALSGSVVQQIVPPEEQNLSNQPTDSHPSKKEPTPPTTSVVLRDKKPLKLYLFRVIKALCLDGFFEDEHGGKINEKDVFAAFGIALNEDFSDYTKHLSEGRNHNSISESANIFDELKEKYLAYERKLKEDKKARNK